MAGRKLSFKETRALNIEAMTIMIDSHFYCYHFFTALYLPRDQIAGVTICSIVLISQDSKPKHCGWRLQRRELYSVAPLLISIYRPTLKESSEEFPQAFV